MTAPRRVNVSPKAAELVARIYASHGAGCCWHVVLDDGNWGSIEFCRQWAAEQSAKGECDTDGACLELSQLDVTPSILERAVRRARV